MSFFSEEFIEFFFMSYQFKILKHINEPSHFFMRTFIVTNFINKCIYDKTVKPITYIMYNFYF
jgi:hypothetical protein